MKMNRINPQQNETRRRALLMAKASAFTLALTIIVTQAAHAEHVRPPRVPSNIVVPAGNEAYLEGHATGTQNYICLANATGFAYVLFTPQATLFNDSDKQITTHFFSPNPAESGTPIRATWLHSRDTSAVWGQVKPGNSSTDPNFVAPNAIAWLLVTAVGVKEGPTGGDTLAEATFIQRVNTTGGLAPATGCASAADVGRQAFVPYTADYVFFRDRNHDEH
jgi:hypothetical protein